MLLSLERFVHTRGRFVVDDQLAVKLDGRSTGRTQKVVLAKHPKIDAVFVKDVTARQPRCRIPTALAPARRGGRLAAQTARRRHRSSVARVVERGHSGEMRAIRAEEGLHSSYYGVALYGLDVGRRFGFEGGDEAANARDAIFDLGDDEAGG